MSKASNVEVETHYTKTEVALRSLRTKISSGELAPGHRLGIRELTEQLSMSPTPVREALRLLQADGLVSHRPHHGMVVAAPSASEIIDIYRMRKVLEPLATEWAVPRLGTPDRERLDAHHARLAVAMERDSRAAAVRENAAWHWIIYEASGSDVLVSFIRRLWDMAPWRTAWVLRRRPDLLNEQHMRLHDAVARGDAREARVLMLAHIEIAEETLLETFRLHSTVGTDDDVEAAADSSDPHRSARAVGTVRGA